MDHTSDNADPASTLPGYPGVMPLPLCQQRPSRSVENYEHLNFIDEGTYGRVFRARDKVTGKIYALKQLCLSTERDSFPITSLREITTLFSVSHPNIVHLREVVVSDSLENVFLVMEYAPHDLLSILQRQPNPYTSAQRKSLIHQLLSGIAHLHHHWILHRDLKPSNLLLSSEGILKICDFGLARSYSDPLDVYTPGVVTLWYRAPELLMGVKKYSSATDIWALGCIFVELISKKPLFPGKGELGQISKIAEILGAPSEERWQGFNRLPNAKRLNFQKSPPESSLRSRMEEAVHAAESEPMSGNEMDLLEKMILYDPRQRISAEDALKHPYFLEAPTATTDTVSLVPEVMNE